MVMRRFTKFIILIILLSSFFSLNAEGETICLDYYYGLDCPDCAAAEKELDLLNLQYPNLEINKIEVYNNLKQAKELETYFEAYNIPENSRGVPAVFVGQNYYIGLNPIQDLLESSIEDKTQLGCPTLDGANVIGIVGEKAPYKVLDTLSLAVVTPEALKDSFNPSMVALFLIVLTILMSIKNHDVMVRRGAVSIGAIYLAYFFIALDLFTVLQNSFISTFFTKVVAILAIVYGLVNIKGFFSTWKIFFGDLSEEKQKSIQDVVKTLLTPLGVFLISFFSALLTLGQPTETLAVLRVLTTEGASKLAAFPLYLYHMFIVIIPLIVLVVLLYLLRNKLEEKAKKKEPNDERKAELWKKHLQKILHLVVSFLTFIVGVVLLLG